MVQRKKLLCIGGTILCPFIHFFWHPPSVGNKLPLVGQGAFTGDHLEIFMEAGEIIEAAFITKPLDALVVFNQELAGMTHAQFDQEL
jgi:hypothetical protein